MFVESSSDRARILYVTTVSNRIELKSNLNRNYDRRLKATLSSANSKRTQSHIRMHAHYPLIGLRCDAMLVTIQLITSSSNDTRIG